VQKNKNPDNNNDNPTAKNITVVNNQNLTVEIEDMYVYGPNIFKTPDNGNMLYVLKKETSGNSYPALIKTDNDNNMQWCKIVVDTGSNYYVSIMSQINDGGYLLGGYKYITGSKSMEFLVKTDASGEVVWTKFYSNLNHISNILELSGNNLYFFAMDSTYDNVVLCKANQSGDIIWSEILVDSIPYSYGQRTFIKSNDNYYIAEFTYKHYDDTKTTLIFKIDENGNILAQNQYSLSENSLTYSFLPVDANSYFCVTYIEPNFDIKVVDNNLNITDKIIQATNIECRGKSLLKLPDNNVLIMSINGMVETDISGNYKWYEVFFTDVLQNPWSNYGIVNNNDGTYTLFGSTITLGYNKFYPKLIKFTVK